MPLVTWFDNSGAQLALYAISLIDHSLGSRRAICMGQGRDIPMADRKALDVGDPWEFFKADRHTGRPNGVKTWAKRSDTLGEATVASTISKGRQKVAEEKPKRYYP